MLDSKNNEDMGDNYLEFRPLIFDICQKYMIPGISCFESNPAIV